ncbi:MAG: acetyl-CoA C-acyltransferase [Streptosporangiales bacterium]|nr:acetyl-CoA C-acyltransferase [Streptosporangiales bacterium]
MNQTAVIVAARRTPIGSAGHALRDIPVADLAAPVLTAVLDDAGIRPGDVDEVVLGNCLGPGGDVARYAALAGGLPATVPGLTVDRQCGSGLAAITTAVALIEAGHVRCALAGGAESASTAPWRYWPPTGPSGTPVRYERAPFAPAELGDPDMGVAADLLAEKHGIGRARQDAYAARSHRLAHAARESGAFDRELTPVAGVRADERPRAALTEERLARLRPAFRPDGTVTAGNSCGVGDGAAAVAVVTEREADRRGLAGLRVRKVATAGVDPQWPGLGIVPAVRDVLATTGRVLPDVDVVELNEAFAGQVLACCDELGLDPDRVCTEGGALALGHPWGASGAILVVRLFSRLAALPEGSAGLAAIAVGGGQGVALLVERR